MQMSSRALVLQAQQLLAKHAMLAGASSSSAAQLATCAPLLLRLEPAITNACRCICTSSPLAMSALPAQERQQPQAAAGPSSASSQQQQQQEQQQAAPGDQGTSSSQQQEQTSSSSSSSTAGPSAEELRQRVFSAFKSGYDGFRSTVGSAASGAGGHQHLVQQVTKEVQDVFRSADNIRSATRLYTGPVMDMSAAGDTTVTALQLVKQQQSTWEKVQQKFWDLPFMSRFGGFKVQDSEAFKKGQQVVEDLKEKYETSDHPMVHKVDEMREKLLTGSESSRAMLEMRTRDPNFDLNTFVRSIKLDGPVVVRALLHRDMEALALHVGPEMMERLTGIFRHETERGVFEDPTILFTSDVEVVEVRLMDGDPFVVAQFHCQQLKCSRDKFGNVVEGSPDAIQRVFYFWGLQQEKQGVVTADGVVLPPRWVIRDMMWQSMLALV